MINYSFNIDNNNISKYIPLHCVVSNTINNIINNVIYENKDNEKTNIINNQDYQNDQNDEDNQNDIATYDYNINSWDDIITNKSYLLKNRIMRIFPLLKNKLEYMKLKIDDESFSFITIREMADFTSKIICHHLITDFTNPLKASICDLTAGVGGNVISFSHYFNSVHAVELEKLRYDYLINNVNIYGLKNINMYNCCAIEFINNSLLEINPSVLFIDPPWGGIGYKNNDSLKLTLGEYSIEDLLVLILNKFSSGYASSNKNLEYSIEHNKIIIFKLPKNYDITYFYNYIKNKCINNYIVKIYLYIFNKMILVLCHCVYVDYQIDS
jgi:16S rRNA G966 N2-methylase RsmD